MIVYKKNKNTTEMLMTLLLNIHENNQALFRLLCFLE